MKNLFLNRKFYKNPLIRWLIALCVKITQFFDGKRDQKICGCSLVKYVPSRYRESMGATGSYSTCYWSLDRIFGDSVFEQSDAFIDVGCGKGRVLAYLVDRGVPCSLTGIELNAEVAAYAAAWAKRYEQITILPGDAFALDYNAYTVLFMGRPFEPEMFYRFIQQLEATLTHPIRLFYWCDIQSGAFLENRAGWNMIRREWVFNHGPLFMYLTPQRYSVWTYDPTAGEQ